MIGLTESSITDYERGKSIPRVRNVRRIANSLDISAGELMGDDMPEYEVAVAQKVDIIARLKSVARYDSRADVPRLSQWHKREAMALLIYLRHLPKPAQATPKINMLALRDAWMDCHFRLHVAGQEGVYYEQ